MCKVAPPTPTPLTWCPVSLYLLHPPLKLALTSVLLQQQQLWGLPSPFCLVLFSLHMCTIALYACINQGSKLSFMK